MGDQLAEAGAPGQGVIVARAEVVDGAKPQGSAAAKPAINKMDAALAANAVKAYIFK
jgi:hypothetical protein